MQTCFVKVFPVASIFQMKGWTESSHRVCGVQHPSEQAPEHCEDYLQGMLRQSIVDIDKPRKLPSEKFFPPMT